MSEEVRLLSQMMSEVATERKLKEVAPLGLTHSSSEISSQEPILLHFVQQHQSQI